MTFKYKKPNRNVFLKKIKKFLNKPMNFKKLMKILFNMKRIK